MNQVIANEFCEMTQEEMMNILGGGWKAAISAFTGGVLVAFTPVGCLLGGVGVGGSMFALGCTALDYAGDNPNK